MFESLEEIRRANQSRGHHFFENEWCMKFPDEKIYHGKFFITEDGMDLGEIQLKPRYTIRKAAKDGTISNVGRYRQFGSHHEAVKDIERILMC